MSKKINDINVISTEIKEQPGKELIKRYTIADTPFTVIEEGGQFFGVMGKYRVTLSYDTREECENDLKEITWNRILQVSLILIQEQNIFKKELDNQVKTED